MGAPDFKEGVEVKTAVEKWAADPVIKEIDPEIQRAFIRFLTKHPESPFGLNIREVMGNSIYPIPLDRRQTHPRQLTILDVFADGYRAALAAQSKEEKPQA